MDGSHTRSKTGGQSVGYQGRKSSKTSNCIFICDNQGQMLSMGKPISGEHCVISQRYSKMKAIHNNVNVCGTTPTVVLYLKDTQK
ncbi:hypothetical protein [Chryseobacterium mulctrae]|uniref:hypothetical protein n=1 Tax=Chryseobacterium mulctrae TaxID=2576777 RepID=UPI001E55A3B1|nr:hypothetical protein [Chryseobacterium mulctrae]